MLVLIKLKTNLDNIIREVVLVVIVVGSIKLFASIKETGYNLL